MVCSYVVLLVLPFKLLLTCYGKVILILLLKLSKMLTGLEIQMIDEEILEEEVLEHEAIALSDEEIALDKADSEASPTDPKEKMLI
ncbi:hypothetical protein Tco_0947705 [Tanacetum coccineum]